jgi:hypothetical protein
MPTAVSVTDAPFPDQVLHWLQTLPVRVEPVPAGDGPFPLLRVLRAGRPALVLHLIGLHGWQEASPQFPALNFFNISQSFRSQGVGFVNLWEDVWLTRRAVVESRLSAQLGISHKIPGRMCQARRIDRPTAQAFLAENHTQEVALARIRYGLYLPERYYRVLPPEPELGTWPAGELLVAVGTFTNLRTIVRDGRPCRSAELVRYASRLGTTVVGGLDKVLRAYTRAHQPDDLMTYADLDWSAGASYERLGFRAEGDTPPHPLTLDLTTLVRYPPHRLPAPESTPAPDYCTVFTSGSRKFVKRLREDDVKVL